MSPSVVRALSLKVHVQHPYQTLHIMPYDFQMTVTPDCCNNVYLARHGVKLQVQNTALVIRCNMNIISFGGFDKDMTRHTLPDKCMGRTAVNSLAQSFDNTTGLFHSQQA